MEKHIYSYNSSHLLRDGRPWLPAMGEFHFSRYPDAYWRDSIRLMKAGGIDITATYIFWNHHESEAGKFDFSGWRNIRKFLDICEEEDMLVCLRIGPYSHGEAKHGGLPDWLSSVPGCRSNHPEYMKCVRRLWEALYREIREHIGGCIVAIQYENEYICGGEDGGDNHISELVRLAEEIGITAPIRTATKCRGQFTGPCLPMFGGYPDAPWDGSLQKLPPSVNYVFTRVRDVGQLGNIVPEERGEEWCDPEGIPFMFAELGGGVQPTLHRRPEIKPKDVGALVSTRLGCGAVLPGIYMYHGGTNPGYGLHESRCFGDATEVAELNYDFQAPIGEYGKPAPVYAELRRIFTFLRDFGGDLAPLPTVIPEDNPEVPGDLEHLRYCLRTDGRRGFLFVNNHVRSYTMPEHTREFCVTADGNEIVFPEMTFKDGDYGFYPFNMPLGSGTLVSANAQPLCRLNDRTYVFFTDRDPIYRTEGDVSGVELLTLSESESRMASKVTVKGKDYLLICDAPCMSDGEALTFLCRKDTVLKVYPAPDGSAGFAEYTLVCPKNSAAVTLELLSSNPMMKEFSLKVSDVPEDAEDVLLDLEYHGNIAELFLHGRKAADQFSLGNGWQIGLKRFGSETEYMLRIFALAENAPVYMDKKPEFRGGSACDLTNVSVTAEYAIRFTGLH